MFFGDFQCEYHIQLKIWFLWERILYPKGNHFLVVKHHSTVLYRLLCSVAMHEILHGSCSRLAMLRDSTRDKQQSIYLLIELNQSLEVWFVYPANREPVLNRVLNQAVRSEHGLTTISNDQMILIMFDHLYPLPSGSPLWQLKIP